MTTLQASEPVDLLEHAEQGASLWRDAWQRLRKNKMAVGGGITLLLFILMALLTPWLAPYSYEVTLIWAHRHPPPHIG